MANFRTACVKVGGIYRLGLSEGLGLGLDCEPLVVYVRAVFVSAPCVCDRFPPLSAAAQIAFGRRSSEGRTAPKVTSDLCLVVLEW